MRFPLPWIQEFADLPGDERACADLFTFSGTEVEGSETVEGETVFEFGITVNRPDCMSAYGLAREASALKGVPLGIPETACTQTGPPVAGLTSVTVEEAGLCPKYCARLIRGARVGQSPPAIQKRLIQCGLRPINAVVDATNYVLLELGHPLHAFDLGRLSGGRIVVRRARPGESLTTLDGVERKLAPDMLVIADAARPVALAGIMGGEDTGVTALTADVLLEGAVFEPVSIRKTSKALGIHTDASHRFERGVDFEGPARSLDRVAGLILECCGGELAEGILEVCPSPRIPPEIPLRFSKLSRVVGVEIPPGRCREILERLGFRILRSDPDCVAVAVPSHRVDIAREADLAEEVIRVEGLDKLPSTLPMLVDSQAGKPSSQRFEEQVRDAFAAAGFVEAIHMSMADEGPLRAFSPEVEPLALSNPLAEQAAVLRTSLAAPLLQCAARNRARGRRQMALFEMGRVYLPSSAPLPREDERLAALLYADDPPCRWGITGAQGILHLKGMLLNVARSVGLRFDLKPADATPYEAGLALEVRSGGRRIGAMGSLAPEVLDRFGFPGGSAHLVEICLEGLAKEASIPRFRPFSRFPPVVRDFSFLVPASTRWEELESAILRLSLEHLSSLELLGVFEGKGIPADLRSWTFSLTFQSFERTLTDEDIAPQAASLVGGMRDAFQGVQR